MVRRRMRREDSKCTPRSVKIKTEELMVEGQYWQGQESLTCATIRTLLHAVAVRVHIDRLYTVCSLHLPPNDAVLKKDVEDLIDQLPEPFLLLGDFNALHPIWRDRVLNAMGRAVARVMEELMMASRLTSLY